MLIQDRLKDRLQFFSWQRKKKGVDQPLRAELFGVLQMERHGKLLAQTHEITLQSAPDQLLKRLSDNEVVLTHDCNLLALSVKENKSIAPAGEWLLDNFYLIEEQIRMAKRHFSKGYSKELPRLMNGPSSGLPRVYGIALEAVAHGDGRVEFEGLSRFVAAYQSISPLTIGELWAIPIMLRLACIENLRRVIAGLASQSADRALANSWADKMIDTAEKDPSALILVVANLARSNVPLVSSFVSELTRRLHGHGPALALPLTWMEQRLQDLGLTTEQLVDAETKLQSADQASVSNSIGTLRFLSSTNWRKFVETNSIVESILGEDPSGFYLKMEFVTRDQYRHAVECIAKRSNFSEVDVAGKVLELARQAQQDSVEQQAAPNLDIQARSVHVGFYLIGKGLPTLERNLKMRYRLVYDTNRRLSQFALLFYLGAIGMITADMSAFLLNRTEAIVAEWQRFLIIPVVVLCTTQPAVAFVNWLVMLFSVPKSLPRLDFGAGIPAEFCTIVAVPSMINSDNAIDRLIESLEVRYLGNRVNNLHFALLTDFPDASAATMPEDEALLERASKQIDALNDKYKSAGAGHFFLFHRPRLWNAQENIFMGFERKRGKLSALNSFLRGGENRFSLIVGDTSLLSNVKYVITLDTDTQLPIDTARQLVGAMAHPLNRPLFDEQKGLVVEGYGILQPRVSVELLSTNKSFYARLFGGEPGIDPYTKAVSDVYQDIFLEGSFIGKGIYDIDAFERSLQARFPENRILSHDLLEGCYARSGLLTDVQLYEPEPALYNQDISRRIRWIRGDWQVSEWLFDWAPGPGGKRLRNQLSFLSRWKIFDNLRRSLTPAAFTIFFLFAWAVVFDSRLWMLFAFGMILLPWLMSSGEQIFKKQEDVLLLHHYFALVRSARQHLAEAVFALSCLPYEGWLSLNAIVRTMYRLLCTNKRLLEWQTSADVGVQNTLAGAYRKMSVAPVVALAAALYLVAARPNQLSLAAPVLALWLLAPLAAWWISRPIKEAKIQFTDSDTLFLRKLARRSWQFFEQFAGSDNNWLPADNYQEQPVERTAFRTSPTNIGLSLLANLNAYNFGYITGAQLVERTTNTFKTMDLLERHRGHFCNWYDTQTLKPLLPIYLSTVDSGNLSGHLLTLKAGLLALPDRNIVSENAFNGLRDTAAVLSECIDHVADGQTDEDYVSVRPLLAELQKNLEPNRQLPDDLAEIALLFRNYKNSAEKISQSIGSTAQTEASLWADRLADQCSSALTELQSLAPWLDKSAPSIETDLLARLKGVKTLSDIAELESKLVANDLSSAAQIKSKNAWRAESYALIATASERAKQRIESINDLALRAEELAQMELGFLFDESRLLLAIGYNVTDGRRDSGFYDLLASEARYCNFIGIAQGQLPQESWFALGRLLTTIGGQSVLLSWTGSMFEYLMPLLVMPSFEHTLLSQTYRAVVERQIEYGDQRGVPWGISESGYSRVDAQLNYQYRSFGVPGLGLKRGLADDLVVAPYATALALMVLPEDALRNLQRLSSLGLAGKFGLYEAIDYTPAHLPRGQSHVVVQSYMAHHQGMTLLSLAYLLLDKPMQKLFETDSAFQATMPLLQERIPTTGLLHWQSSNISERIDGAAGKESPVRVFDGPSTIYPEIHLLSNGRYHVLVTNAGGGSSRFNDLFLTRWREDATLDNWGSFCYIKDSESGELWSTAYQPTHKRSESDSVIFSEAKVEFRRRDFDIDTYTEIVVSSEDDIELRRVRLTNHSDASRKISVTSYAEVVLATADADSQQPAFSNLFVQTEIIEQYHAILCTRRPRSAEEKPPWLFHLMVRHKGKVDQVSYETDRSQFIGRGRTIASPRALEQDLPLSGSHGSVLDPIASVQHRVTLEPAEAATLNIVTGIAETREQALALIEKYQDRVMSERVFDLAWTHAQVVLRQLNASEADAQLYARLANSIVFANSMLRTEVSILAKNRRGQSGLWGYAISGDLPIVLLQIKHPENIGLARQLVQAHAYWRLKGLKVDLLIVNEDTAGYRQLLQDQIVALIAGVSDTNLIDKPGGIFIRPASQLSSEDRTLLQSVARAIFSDSRGTLEQQLNRRPIAARKVARLQTYPEIRSDTPAQPPARHLILFNGLGGFTPDGREYVITTSSSDPTPAPWVNVLANPYFGTVISESGVGYTWAENAHEFRLTPWHNDPVSDTSGEAFYIRDQRTGRYWSPSPLPAPGDNPYVSRHGFGYSAFEHTESEISSELTVHVALDAPIKFSVLKVRNDSSRPRQLSVTGYVEWVLGDLRSKYAMQVITQIDPKTGAVFAHNAYNTEFQDRVNFFDVDDLGRTITCDRAEFLGRNGSLRSPLAMSYASLSNRVGGALDPCTAIQILFELKAGEERQFIFRLGSGRDANDASALVNRFRGSQARHGAYEMVCEYWKRTLGAVNVRTPDDSVNMLTNGWLLYQAIACRMWGRSGFYQSGGAFGFRDQIQDAMAVIHAEPKLLRDQLILCGSRQFIEGDAQHWWHPPSGRGVRSHCSDDFLWLPLATCRYVSTTGDTGVLDEQINFLDGPPVTPGQDSYYAEPTRSPQQASLYEHCKRAILHGLNFGGRGLPLMGSGDWNDGMNLVGIEGKGESVWLAFFLCDVLRQFSKIARFKEDEEFAQSCERQALSVRETIEQNAWDGEWYRRAYFDDGTPLGSKSNPECKIDSIAQSWSILSSPTVTARSRQAMNSLDKLLVNRDKAIVQLLEPPFDKSQLNPGYIKGYVPGVRENGGQYTHAAIWAAMAFASMGDSEKAWQLLSIINPINHGKTPQGVAVYKVEPYVVAGDVYAGEPHTGRGGWTWYTGSAGWLYRLIVESLLGVRLEVNKLRIAPCLPADWPEYTIHYRHHETVYHITVIQGEDPPSVVVDGACMLDAAITLNNDHREHFVEVKIKTDNISR